MKYIPICSAIVILLTNCSVQISSDTTIIEQQPFKVKEHGITHGESFLTCEGDTLKKSTFYEGQTFTLHLLDLKGIKEVNNEYQCELEFVVKNEKGEIVLQEKGIEQSIPNSSQSVDIRLSLDCDMEHNEEEQMQVYYSVNDRNSNHGIIANIPFKITKNEYIHLQSKGLYATPIYLVNAKERKVVKKNRLPHHPQNRLIVGKLKGLTEKNGKVSYSSMTTAIQPNGDTIMQLPYLSKGNGVLFDPIEVGSIPFNLNLNGAGNTTFIIEIEDELSDKSLTIKTKLQLY